MFNYGNNDINLIKSNQIVMEGLRQISLDLPPAERLHYTDIACETLMSRNDQASLINTLYKSISSKTTEIDFGKIPDSKGDITKYYYYQQMVNTLEILTSLENADQVNSITLASKLHVILLSNTESFVYGYKRDVEIIKSTYALSVMLLYQLIDIGISDYTKVLASVVDPKFKLELAGNLITSSAKQLIKYFEDGQFRTLFQSIKKSSAMQSTENVKAASESVGDALLSGGTFAVSSVAGVLSGTGFFGFMIVLLSILIILRPIVYFLSKGTTSLSQWARRQANFIQVAMEAERSSDPDVMKRRKKMSEKLLGLADVIDYQILKTERLARMDIIANNKSELNTKQISIVNDGAFSF